MLAMCVMAVFADASFSNILIQAAKAQLFDAALLPAQTQPLHVAGYLLVGRTLPVLALACGRYSAPNKNSFRSDDHSQPTHGTHAADHILADALGQS
jgi:hypothetical protein